MPPELIDRIEAAHLAGHAFRTHYNAQANRWHGIVAVAPHMRPEFVEGGGMVELWMHLLAHCQNNE